MTNQTVTWELGSDGIAFITLRRPEVRNAVNGQMMRELRQALAQFDGDERATVAVLSGQGAAFCAGADLKERQDVDRVDPLEDRTRLAELFLVRNRYKPIVASVHGHVIGMGLHMALLSDFVVCASDTAFRAPEVGHGLGAGTYWWHLQSRCGDAFAMDVTGTGRSWSGDEAAQRGLVTTAVDADQQSVAVGALAATLSGQPPAALQALIETRRAALRTIELQAWQTRARDMNWATPAPAADTAAHQDVHDTR
jgi:enoyl-CoA hydratase/carnithine racemase